MNNTMNDTKNKTSEVDLSVNLTTFNHRLLPKDLGVFKLKLTEVSVGKIQNFNTVSLIFESSKGKKYFLDRLFLDTHTFHKAINMDYDLNHQLLEILGIPNIIDMVKNEYYDENELLTKLQKSIGIEVYLALYVKIDSRNTTIFYDHKLMCSFNIYGQSLREIKHNVFSLRDMYFREDMLVPHYSLRYQREESIQIKLNKDVGDLLELSHSQMEKQDGRTIKTSNKLKRCN